MNQPTPAFTAVVLAADRADDDPVAKAAGVCCKSLTAVGGTPMVLRVIAALDAAQDIESCLLSGPRRSAVEEEADLRTRIASGQLRWLEPQATPSASAYYAMQSLPEHIPVLVTTADHALLTARIVDYFCSEARATGGDVVVGVARHQLVAAAFPGVRRTAMRLRDGGYCGCNLFAFLTPRGRAAALFWRRVETQRKRPWRVVSALGWMAVSRYLLGRLSLAEGLAGISRRMGLRVGAVLMPFPEAALDVDTVSDWMLAQAIVRDLAP